MLKINFVCPPREQKRETKTLMMSLIFKYNSFFINLNFIMSVTNECIVMGRRYCYGLDFVKGTVGAAFFHSTTCQLQNCDCDCPAATAPI